MHFILSTDRAEAYRYVEENLKNEKIKDIVFASTYYSLEGAFGGGFEDKAHILKSADQQTVKHLKMMLESRGENSPYSSIVFEKKKHTFSVFVREGNTYVRNVVQADSFVELSSHWVYGADLIIDEEGNVHKNRFGSRNVKD